MEKIKCEGNCLEHHGEHKGIVSPVVVYGQAIKPTKFNYCENAIKEDLRRGFVVEIKPIST